MGDRSLIRLAGISFFVFLGVIVGVLLVPAMEGKNIPYGAGAAALIIIVLFIALARMYIQKQRTALESAGEGEKGSKVGFVVDTFHDLVAKLKEKEKELEKLKALAEEKAVRMEAYNDNILQSVPSGVISVDTALIMRSINNAAERMLGVNAGGTIGKRFDDVFREPLTVIMREAKTVLRAEYPYITDDGRHIWLGITTSELKNSRGDKIGLIFVFTDLTDIKALQSQVELKQRLSQLGEMSAGISHELRNSMSVIAGYAKLLGKRVDPANKGTVDAIQEEIGSMDEIISELLAFAKPNVLSTQKVLINDMVRETAETAAENNDLIRVSINAAAPVTVKADTVLLRQALTNLFINAVEAMPEGGSIAIDIIPGQGKAEIHIQDSGQGIPEDIRPKIFLPFFTTKEKGIGFGLALVQKIIVSHGGSIEVDSVEGKGTVFRIALPSEQ